jgi:hypothetical protein
MITVKPHKFYAHEWAHISVSDDPSKPRDLTKRHLDYTITKEQLIQELRSFQRIQRKLGISLLCTYFPNGWSDDAIRFFLELHPWLYPGSLPQEHHIRCIATIIQRGELR